MPFNQAQSCSKILQKNYFFKKTIINFSKVNTALLDKLNLLKKKMNYHRIQFFSSIKLHKRINIQIIMNIQTEIMTKIICLHSKIFTYKQKKIITKTIKINKNILKKKK